jgi:hypothetical protein
VEKLAEVLKLSYNERSSKTLKNIKDVKDHGFDQWKVILGESMMENKFKYYLIEISKMWQDVFEDTRERPKEVLEDYGLETDEQEEEKKADDGSKVGDTNLE